MLNVIRMEIYRMFHSVSFYTTILLCAAMAGGLLLSQSNSINKYYDGASSQEAAGMTVKDKDGDDVYAAGNDDEAKTSAGDAVNIQHYLPSLYSSDYRYGSLLGGGVEDMTEMLIHAAALSICALVVYNRLGCLILTKKDI